MSINARVVVAPLGRRFVAWLVDRIVPTALVVAFIWVNTAWLPDAWLVHDVVLTVVLVAWVMIQWWAYGTRGAGLGYRMTGLQLVRLSDGRPLGWGRMCLRTLILQAATMLVIPGVILAIMLVIQERRQGWMDLAVGSVCVRRQPRVTAEAPTTPRPVPARQVVGLPAHLIQPGFVEPTPSSAPPAATVAPPPPPAEPIRQVPRIASHVVPGRQPTTSIPDRGTSQPSPSPAQPGAMTVPTRPATTAPATAPAVRPMEPAPPAGSTADGHLPATGVGGATFGALQRTTPPPTQHPASRGVAVPRMRPRQVGDESQEGTRLVAGPSARAGDEGWIIRLDDGRQVPLTGTLLIGRDPAPRPTDAAVDLLAAGEPSRTVSKTHLSVGVDSRGVFLVDRGSTNGTAVRGPNGELQPCPPDATVRLAEGQVVSFGERTLQIIRRHP